MLKTQLLHPEILQALAANGHGATILISDGNYPATTGAPASAKKVFLNFSPGMLNVTDILKVLSEIIPIESYSVMVPPDKSQQSIHKEFIEILGEDIPATSLLRFDFYEQALLPQTCLVIATGEQRIYANILLTIGVVKPD
jgi:L-fucose mutarotase